VYIPFWPFNPPFYEIISGIVSGGHVNNALNPNRY